MPFTREDLRQIAELIRPVRNRIRNVVARAVVGLVDESTKLQLLQVGLLAGEDADGVENFQGFGFKSVPLPGSEAVAVFPDADRGVGLVVATEDRRHRPTGWEGGEAGTYNAFLLQCRLRDDGTIEAGMIGGTFKALAFKSDVDAVDARVTTHIHATTATVGSGPAVGVLSPTTTPPATIVGTTNLKGT